VQSGPVRLLHPVTLIGLFYGRPTGENTCFVPAERTLCARNDGECDAAESFGPDVQSGPRDAGGESAPPSLAENEHLIPAFGGSKPLNCRRSLDHTGSAPPQSRTSI
jgi:hypothetical protein